MSRLPMLTRDQLNDAQRRLHDNLTGGERAKAPRKFPLENDDGSLNGPFNVYLYRPEIGDVVQKLGHELRFASDLSGQLREVAIITVAQHWRSNYEWFAHALIAQKEGVSDEAIAMIKDGKEPTGNDQWALVHRLVSEFLKTTRVSDATYARAIKAFGEPATAELVILAGFYCMVSGVLNVFEVGMPREKSRRSGRKAHREEKMQLTMNGRNALITGGSLGIGRAIAAGFVSAGANVAIVARRQDTLDEAKAEISKAGGGKVVTISADVATAQGCADAFAEAEKALGQIDVLVNNAGSSARAPFPDITDQDWQADIDLKLFGAIRLARLAFPKMKQRKWGRIINILNTGAKAPPAEGAPTAVTRAAGMALTKVMAGEGAAFNVLVNSLHVGRIESDQWVKRHAGENKGRSLEDFYAEMGATLPMKRVGTAEEFANAAVFLASDQGSYITGAAINVDGGLCPMV